MFSYKTSGTCSREIQFEIEDNRIKSVRFEGGCPGNLLGISNIVQGMEVDQVIQRFENVTCGSKATSCPDQLATALKKYQQKIG